MVISNNVTAQVEFRQHNVPIEAHRTWGICAEDLDGDGDMDFLVTAETPGFFAWYEVDDDGDLIEHIFHENAEGACSIRACDIDGDGDMDITGSAREVSRVWWWENDGNQNFEAHLIAEGFRRNSWIRPVDLDDDGDIDLVGGNRNNILCWWENDGEQDFAQRMIDGQFGGVIEIIDFDGDNDLDVICGDFSEGVVRWYENDGNQNFNFHQVGNHGGVWAVYPADFDNDGDMDIASGAERTDLVVWWENEGNGNFERHDIENNIEGTGMHVGDIDADGDPDIIVAAYDPDVVKWYENDGDGNFDIHLIAENLRNAIQTYTADVDFDGDLDVMASAWSDDGARWWENLLDPAPAEPEVDPNPMEAIIAFPLEDENILTITNVGEEGSELRFNLWDDGEGIDWLSCDPLEGILGFEEAAEILCTFTTQDLEPGEYERLIIIRTNAREFRRIEVPVILSVNIGNGELRGIVTDMANEEPIEGALITCERFEFEAISDENGVYAFDEIPEWEYTINIQAEDYLTQRVEDVEVIEDEVTVLDFDLLHSVCELSIEEINEQMPVNEETEISFTLSNPGNGNLTWNVNRVFPEGMEAEPWQHRWGLDAEEVLENNRLGGVEIVDNNFYIAGGRSNEDNLIYVLNRDGEHIGQFAQFGDSRYGYRDIAFDENLLWGVDGEIVYGFTTEGELEVTFESPVRSTRCITWDRVNDLLWISSITTDIIGISRAGEAIRVIERPDDLRMYGLSCYPDDPDGYTIYMFCSNGDLNREVHKLNIETGEIEFVAEPDIEGSAGACTVTRAWDPFSWVFMAITNLPDRIEIWHLDAPSGWVDIEPTEGTLEADRQVDLTAQLNTFSFPVNIEFTADLVFTHDGVGGESIVPVTLLAGEDGPEERVLELVDGWNMVSINVDPPENDVIALTQPLVDEDRLEIMKNGVGQFYSPAFGFCNIPGWDVAEGYMMKVTQECQLAIEGLPVPADQVIPLEAGWQMVAYFPRVEMDAITAFSGIVDALEMAKDGFGRFYNTAFGFSNMGNLREGMGYMVKTTEAVDLVYVVDGEFIGSFIPCNYQTPELLPIVKPTDQNMSLLVISDGIAMERSEIGVYTSDCLVGTGRFVNGMCGIAIWGDDQSTKLPDGAFEDQELELRYYGEEGVVTTNDFEPIVGSGVYESNGFWVVRVHRADLPEQFGIISAYPNPFNSTTVLKYNIPAEQRVEINVFNIDGRFVCQPIDSKQSAGHHSVTIYGDDFASGIYLVRMESMGLKTFRKVLLMK